MNRNFVSATLAFALVLPLAGSVAFAQAAAGSAVQHQEQTTSARQHHDPHAMAMKLGRKLNLTSDQVTKLEPILAERQQKIEAVRADASLSEEQRHKQMHAIARGTHVEIAGVLTPEQMQQWKAMRKTHEEKEKAAGV